jgi:DNA-binding MarR family transcriptional regulator
MARSNNDKAKAGRFSYEGLDRVIHERARLSILTSLIANKRGLLFSDLKRLCALSDGNLSRHLQVLQEAKLIAVSKGFEKNRPQTVCRITALGRMRYLEYVEVLEQVVRDATDGMSEQPRGVTQRLAPA